MKENNLEAESELKKSPIHQINDLIEETKREMDSGDVEGKNLDRIKHLLKRIGFQQAAIDYKTSKTNRILILLTCIAAIPAIEVIIRLVDFLIQKYR